MESSKFLYILLTMIAGISVTIQGPMNAALGKGLKSSVLSTFWCFGAGTVLILAYMLLSKTAIPSLADLKSIPFWAYLGTVTGLIFVGLIVVVVPHLGIGTTTVVLIFAQIVVSLLLDHFGLLGLDVNYITLQKVIGAVLILAGVYMVSK